MKSNIYLNTSIGAARFFVLAAATAGLFLFVSTFRSSAAFDDLDATFGNGGIVISPFTPLSDKITSIQVQPDGKIIVSGYSYEYNGVAEYEYEISGFIARYNSSGTLDASFGSNGKILIGNRYEYVGRKTILQPDGKIVSIGLRGTLNAAGNLVTAVDFAVFRYNANGTLDDSFGTGGKVFTSVGDGQFAHYYEDTRDVVLQPDGKIVVMGFIFVNGSGYKFGIVRYNPDGSLDNNFGMDGKVITPVASDYDNDVNSMLLQPDGKIVLVGRYGYDIMLVRYNPDGSLDSGFGVNGKYTHPTTEYDGGWDSVLQPDGKIVVAGFAGSGNEIVRYNADGSVDKSFGVNGIFRTESGYGVPSIALQPDGKIVSVGSGSLTLGEDPTWGFATVRLNPDGSPDTSFGTNGRLLTPVGTNGRSFGLAVALQTDGKILGAGVTDAEYGVGDAAIVRYANSSSVEISGRITTPDRRGLSNAAVKLTDSLGVTRTVTTSSFGFYTFSNVPVGGTYVIGVNSRLYRFASRNLVLTESLENVDFVGLE